MDGLWAQIDKSDFPGWMPENIVHYLMHTVSGVSIRELARRQGVHASTIMRQVRRAEVRRDDVLIEGGLTRLSAAMEAGDPLEPDEAEFTQEAIRVLRRLCESGAVLAVAEDMPNAIVMRGAEQGAGTRTAVVAVEIVQSMALSDWLICSASGKLSRYTVSAAGRAALGQLIAAEENRARSLNDGFAETQTPFGGPADGKRIRHIVTESPLIALSRRRDRDGNRFLDDDLVRAGERLREDYELARMGTGRMLDVQRMLSAGGTTEKAVNRNGAPNPAQARLAEAMEELGPGLADIALRCCCYLEGLESTEKQMGWSARSGKIVLRIALQRLSLHYERAAARGGDLIG